MRTAALLSATLLAAALAVACDKPERRSAQPATTPTTPEPNAATPAPDAAPRLGNTELTLEQALEGLPEGKKLVAAITTSKGKITCELLPDVAPKTVASFVGLARGLRPWRDPATGEWIKRPFYDGLLFHRVIPQFMIQGGDPLSRNPRHPHVGTGGPGFNVSDEFSKTLKFDRPGRLAMAHTSEPNSGGSQFFITEVAYSSLDHKYTIFGQCSDLGVLKAVARVPRDGQDKPFEPVTMQVEIERR